MRSPVIEFETGSGDEVTSRRGHKDLTTSGETCHARGDVHSYATRLTTRGPLDFPCVQTCPDLESES